MISTLTKFMGRTILGRTSLEKNLKKDQFKKITLFIGLKPTKYEKIFLLKLLTGFFTAREVKLNFA